MTYNRRTEQPWDAAWLNAIENKWNITLKISNWQSSIDQARLSSRGLKIAVGLMILLALWLGHQSIFDFLTFVGNREAVTAYVQSYGLWGPVLLLLLLSVQVVFAVIPGHVIMITAGYLYGFNNGLLLNFGGTVVASQIAFMVARLVGKPLVARLAPDGLLARWEPVANRQGFLFFLFFFWFPIIPSNVMNFVAALSPLSATAFLAANILGRLPGVALITLIGSHGLELSTQQWILIAVIGAGLFFGGRYAANKLQQRQEVIND